MYRPKENKLVFIFFTWYIKFIIKKDFSNFSFDKSEYNTNKSILLLSNHFSWWDGFFIFYINKLYFKKQFHVLVSGENYNKVGFLKYLGAFAPATKGKDIIETLKYAGDLLNDPNNLVLVFPQGKLQSNHIKNIAFEKGIMQIINSSQKQMEVVFSASFIDYFSKRKPSVYTYLQKWDTEEYISLQLLKSSYNKHYEQSILKQSKITE
jgi:hypothetical protein